MTETHLSGQVAAVTGIAGESPRIHVNGESLVVDGGMTNT